MFHDFGQSVPLAFGQRTHISHAHHSRGQCCCSARSSYDVPYMGAISYQKTFASALTTKSGGIWKKPTLQNGPEALLLARGGVHVVGRTAGRWRPRSQLPAARRSRMV